MIGVNLIPAARLERRQRRTRARVATSAGCYAVFLTVALGVARFAGSGDDRDLRAELLKARSGVAAAQVAHASQQKELDEAVELLAASRAVGDPPDWSVLLDMLADATGPDLVLSECRIESSRDGATVAASPVQRPGAAGTVELVGIGPSQQTVSDFLLDLDRSPLFGDVRLRDTRREPFLNGSVIAFRVDFALTPNERPPPQKGEVP